MDQLAKALGTGEDTTDRSSSAPLYENMADNSLSEGEDREDGLSQAKSTGEWAVHFRNGNQHSSAVGSTVWSLSGNGEGSRRAQLPHLAVSPGSSEEEVLASPHTGVQVAHPFLHP